MKINFLYIILGLLLFSIQIIANEKKVTIVSTEFPPFTSVHLENYGYSTDIVIQAFKEVGYKVEIKLYPWARALNLAKEGKVDGILAWHTKEREKWFLFSEPVIPQIVGFYKRKKDNITFNSYSDLKSYKIGFVRGYAIPFALKDLNLEIELVTRDELNLFKLAEKRIDLVLIYKSLAEYLINTNYPELADSIEWMEPAVSKNKNYVAFSKKTKNSSKKLKDFNLGLNQLREQGRVKGIIKKHMSKK